MYTGTPTHRWGNGGSDQWHRKRCRDRVCTGPPATLFGIKHTWPHARLEALTESRRWSDCKWFVQHTVSIKRKHFSLHFFCTRLPNENSASFRNENILIHNFPFCFISKQMHVYMGVCDEVRRALGRNTSWPPRAAHFHTPLLQVRMSIWGPFFREVSAQEDQPLKKGLRELAPKSLHFFPGSLPRLCNSAFLPENARSQEDKDRRGLTKKWPPSFNEVMLACL